MDNRTLWVQHGDDPAAMTEKLLERANLKEWIVPGMRVGLKPNVVMPRPASTGTTTHVSIVEALVDFLWAQNVSEIVVMESAWIGDDTWDAFRACGYRKLKQQKQVTLLDLKQDATVHRQVNGERLEICRSPLEMDLLINLPVLKGHCQTGLTCALKNLKGCIPDHEKRRYHRKDLHESIARLNQCIQPDLVLVDAMNGDLSYEGGGSPVPLNRLALGRDPVLMDAWAARLIGFSPGEIGYLRRARVLGMGLGDPEMAGIVEEGRSTAKVDWSQIPKPPVTFAERIEERQACSACFATLLHAFKRLEDQGLEWKETEPVKIGQGFQGISGSGPGIGHCTCWMDRWVPGCPPQASTIIKLFKEFGLF